MSYIGNLKDAVVAARRAGYTRQEIRAALSAALDEADSTIRAGGFA